MIKPLFSFIIIIIAFIYLLYSSIPPSHLLHFLFLLVNLFHRSLPPISCTILSLRSFHHSLSPISTTNLFHQSLPLSQRRKRRIMCSIKIQCARHKRKHGLTWCFFFTFYRQMTYLICRTCQRLDNHERNTNKTFPLHNKRYVGLYACLMFHETKNLHTLPIHHFISVLNPFLFK